MISTTTVQDAGVPGVADHDLGARTVTSPLRTAPTPRTATATRLALTEAPDVVRLGLEALLRSQPVDPRPRVVDSHALRPELCDVVLVSTHDETAAASRVHDLVSSGFALVATIGEPLAFRDRQVLETAGARVHVGLDLPAPELVATLQALPERCRVAGSPKGQDVVVLPPALQAAGCSQREADVLTLICRGLSNQEIAAELFLGINTVKTYVRTAYRKIGVTTRTRAVLWGLHHGL